MYIEGEYKLYEIQCSSTSDDVVRDEVEREVLKFSRFGLKHRVPMFKNLSFGAHAAMAHSPPTVIPVYTAALASSGPPIVQIGTSDRPIAVLKLNHAACFANVFL